MAGDGAAGGEDGVVQAAAAQRPVFDGGNVSAGCGLVSVSDVAITIPTLTANHGVISAPRIMRPKSRRGLSHRSVLLGPVSVSPAVPRISGTGAPAASVKNGSAGAIKVGRAGVGSLPGDGGQPVVGARAAEGGHAGDEGPTGGEGATRVKASAGESSEKGWPGSSLQFRAASEPTPRPGQNP